MSSQRKKRVAGRFEATGRASGPRTSLVVRVASLAGRRRRRAVGLVRTRRRRRRRRRLVAAVAAPLGRRFATLARPAPLDAADAGARRRRNRRRRRRRRRRFFDGHQRLVAPGRESMKQFQHNDNTPLLETR